MIFLFQLGDFRFQPFLFRGVRSLTFTSSAVLCVAWTCPQVERPSVPRAEYWADLMLNCNPAVWGMQNFSGNLHPRKLTWVYLDVSPFRCNPSMMWELVLSDFFFEFELERMAVYDCISSCHAVSK